MDRLHQDRKFERKKKVSYQKKPNHRNILKLDLFKVQKDIKAFKKKKNGISAVSTKHLTFIIRKDGTYYKTAVQQEKKK